MMSSTAVTKLEEYAKRCKGHNLRQQKKDIAGLVVALCQEPGLLAALEEAGHHPPWRPKLHEFLETNKDLPVSNQERMLLRLFAGDETAVAKLKDKSRESMMTFSVAGGGRMDDLLRWRVL